MPLREIFGRIEERLIALGLSERAASVRAGLGPDTLRGIRRAVESNNHGRSGISSRTLVGLANVLGVTTNWLLTGKDDPEAFEGGADLPAAPLIGWEDLALYGGPPSANPALADADPLGPGYDGALLAAKVPDASMDRVSPKGAHIIIDRADRELMNGRYYVGVFRGEVIYRVWRTPPDRAEPFSTDPSYTTAFVIKAAKWDIIGRVRRSILDL